MNRRKLLMLSPFALLIPKPVRADCFGGDHCQQGWVGVLPGENFDLDPVKMDFIRINTLQESPEGGGFDYTLNSIIARPDKPRLQIHVGWDFDHTVTIKDHDRRAARENEISVPGSGLDYNAPQDNRILSFVYDIISRIWRLI